MQISEQAQAFAQDFHHAGFGVIQRALTAGVAADLRTRLEQLFADQPAKRPTPLQRFVPRIVEHDAQFTELALNPQLIATLRDVFGVVPQLVCSYGHEKPAQTSAHTGPHSDVAHLPGVPHHDALIMVKVMYALTRVMTGSGGTVIYPGTHCQPAGSDFREDDGHYVALEPGDMLIFHANVRHTATDNPSNIARLSVWFMYALPWMRVFPGYEYSADFIAGIRRRAETEPDLGSVFGLRDPYAT